MYLIRRQIICHKRPLIDELELSQMFTPQAGTSSPRGRLASPGGPNPAAGASPRLKPHDPDQTKLNLRLDWRLYRNLY